MRGTPEAYSKLAIKNSDTLYFISEPDALDGALYLGSKLIAGGNDANLSLSINDLSDVIIDAIADKQLLVYDLSKSAWVNATVDEVILAFTGATEHSAGVAGLVPAPVQGQTNAFLRSDGTWAEINASQNITSIVNDNHKDHSAIMIEVESIELPAIDDILIIKDLISNDKYQYTAYVYNGTDWEAMDGNYSADKVYFKNDFIFTEPIGTVTIPSSGNAVVPAAGKNIHEFFNTLFAQEDEPIITQPGADILLGSSVTSYEVGSTFTPKYSVRFYPGEYEFGPDTGVMATAYSIRDTLGNKSNLASDTFEEVLVDENFSYQIYGTISHSDGKVPYTNLGNEYKEGQIVENDIEVLSKNTVVGHRNTFYGTFPTKKETLTPEDIRELKSSGKELSDGASFSINIPLGAKRIVIAYPATLRELTSVEDMNTWGTNIAPSFKETSIMVGGYEGYKPIAYRVYVLDYSTGAIESNIYKVTI